MWLLLLTSSYKGLLKWLAIYSTSDFIFYQSDETSQKILLLRLFFSCKMHQNSFGVWALPGSTVELAAFLRPLARYGGATSWQGGTRERRGRGGRLRASSLLNSSWCLWCYGEEGKGLSHAFPLLELGRSEFQPPCAYNGLLADPDYAIGCMQATVWGPFV